MPLSLSRTIRYWRLLHHWTLRDLASRCDFSHTHAAALERGTLPSPHHLKQLENAFGVTLKEDEVLKLQLENFESQISQMILLHQQAQADAVEPKLKAIASLYFSSAYAFDYQFLVTILHVLISSKPWVSTAEEIGVFDALLPLLKPQQAVLYRLVQATHATQESRHSRAVETLTNAIKYEDLGMFKGVYHQYLANVYNDTFYLKLSAKQFNEACLHFEETHNYYRLRAAHLRASVLELVDRQDENENERVAIKKEALNYGFKGLDRSVSMVLAQNYIKQHRYHDALDQLKNYVLDSQKASFIQAVAYFFLGESEQVKAVYAHFKSWRMHPLFMLGFEALIHRDNEDKLRSFYERTTQGLNAFENTIALRLLHDFYERHRRYKHLLELTLQNIHLMQTSV